MKKINVFSYFFELKKCPFEAWIKALKVKDLMAGFFITSSIKWFFMKSRGFIS